jgi:hypothetical protein
MSAIERPGRRPVKAFRAPVPAEARPSKAASLFASLWFPWFAAALLSACGFNPRAPEEFAQYHRGYLFKGPMRAMSPDGVLFTVRTESNDPKADLAFWRGAMKTRMSQAGYRVVADTTCSMHGTEGALLRLAAPVGNQDYLYWIAFSLNPSGSRILVAEAAGESKRFLARQDDIAKAIAETGW